MTARAAKHSFRRIPSGSACSCSVGLVLNRAPIEEFGGDYLVTSTNRRLEGIHRTHWWGFAGRSGCDASLHGVYRSSKSYPNYLVTESRMELKKLALDAETRSKQPPWGKYERKDLLPFAFCVITGAGPFLPNIRRVVHTCVPRYPNTGKRVEPQLHTTLPHAWVYSSQEALDLLQQCYDNVFASILRREEEEEDFCKSSQVWEWIPNMFSGSQPSRSKKELSICLPAIGCGYNGYPIEEAASIALDCIYGIDDKKNRRKSNNTAAEERKIVVEVRFNETRTFRIWEEEVLRRSPSQFRSIE